MKKLKFILIFGIFLLFTLVYLNKSSYKFKEIDVSTLAMEKTDMPNRLACDWYDSTNIWDYEERYLEEYLYLGKSESDSKSFQWIEDNNGIVVNIVIVNYQYPIIASLYYYIQNPAFLYNDSYENFIDSRPAEVIPRNWKNEFSDQDSMQCGSRDTEYCHGLFYRARYGQYFIYIRDHGPDCVNSFEQNVKSINEQFIEFLK